MLGYGASSPENMAAFRHCQQNMPMPNCAVFTLTGIADGGVTHWSVKANAELPQ
jgi:hypothetical protein